MVDEFSGLDEETVGGATVAAAQAAAEATETAIASGEMPRPAATGAFNASNFQDRLLDIMGVPRGTFFGHQGIWNEGDFREAIGERTPAEFLDALAEASPELHDIAEIIKNDSNLATAFHSAVVNNPSVLRTFQSMMGATGEDAVTLDDIEEMLSDPNMGYLARRQLTQTLTQLSDHPDQNADVLLDMARRGRQMANFNLTEMLDRMQNDPAGLIREFLPADLLNSELGQGLAGMLVSIMPALASFLDPNGEAISIGPFVRAGQDVWSAAVNNGQIALSTPAEQTGETQDTREHASGTFDRATAGEIDPEDLSANPSHVAPEVAATRVAPSLPAHGVG